MFPDFSPIVAFFVMSIFLMLLGCCVRAALLKSQRRELTCRPITLASPPSYLRQSSGNQLGLTSVWIVPATSHQAPSSVFAPVHGHNTAAANEPPPPYVLPPSYESVVGKVPPTSNENRR